MQVAHERRGGALEVGDQGGLALYARVGHLADLSRVELGPGVAVELGVEGRDVSRRDQVDERIPDVAPMAEVDGKVE